MAGGLPSAQEELRLMTDLWEIGDDLLKFVLFAYPWGERGTPLHDEKGPRKWQAEELDRISQHIADNKNLILRGETPEIFQSATVSGRGVGKSSLVAWLSHWMMTCQTGSSTIVTANTEDQLKSKTWGEVGKWHSLSINSHWFDKAALSVKPADWFLRALKKQEKIDDTYYYSKATLWDEDKPDSFAGLHNKAGVLLIFDEASGIPKPIWTVSEGFFTEPTPYRFWFAFSNGRRNTGPFFECFHKDRAFWRRRNLDSRHVEGTDKKQLQKIIDKHGDDSDEARIEVKGEFPRQGDKQFISREIVTGAIEREILADPGAPLILGVDPARYGDDSTVIWFRHGRDARSIPPIVLKGADNMQVANCVAQCINDYNPEAVCVDVGNGSGIIDRLREMNYKVHEVTFGGASPDEEYANFRTYIWARMREWLGGGCIPPDTDLIDDLTSPEYKFLGANDRIALESKEAIKKRGFASPDRGDALACTFAVNIARRDIRTNRNSGGGGRNRLAKGLDYSVLG